MFPKKTLTVRNKNIILERKQIADADGTVTSEVVWAIGGSMRLGWSSGRSEPMTFSCTKKKARELRKWCSMKNGLVPPSLKMTLVWQPTLVNELQQLRILGFLLGNSERLKEWDYFEGHSGDFFCWPRPQKMPSFQPTGFGKVQLAGWMANCRTAYRRLMSSFGAIAPSWQQIWLFGDTKMSSSWAQVTHWKTWFAPKGVFRKMHSDLCWILVLWAVRGWQHTA